MLYCGAPIQSSICIRLTITHDNSGSGVDVNCRVSPEESAGHAAPGCRIPNSTLFRLNLPPALTPSRPLASRPNSHPANTRAFVGRAILELLLYELCASPADAITWIVKFSSLTRRPWPRPPRYGFARCALGFSVKKKH